MRKRTNRLIVAVLLVAAGIAGGFFVFAEHLQAEATLTASRDVAARLERMTVTAGDIASSQQAYVAPGQPDQPWRERSATLLRQLADDVAALRPRLRSADAARGGGELAQGLEALIAIDGKARQDLLEGQYLLTADLIFSEGRDTVETLIMAIRDLRSAEQSAATAQSAVIEDQQWTVLGIVGLLWITGLVILVPAPAGRLPDAAPTTILDLGLSMLEPPIGDAPGAPTPIDLAALADLCASLARLSDTASLPDALARAATVLDARGIIVWMGAGEELLPALAHGYDARFVARLGPIPRNAQNATAKAWRSEEMHFVTADGVSHGALAAPLSGVSGCMGVFAAEVRHGREEDPSMRAVAAIIAAQLASIVSAWPAGSAASPADITDSGPLAASAGARRP